MTQLIGAHIMREKERFYSFTVQNRMGYYFHMLFRPKWKKRFAHRQWQFFCFVIASIIFWERIVLTWFFNSADAEI